MYRRYAVPFEIEGRKLKIPVYTVDSQEELADGTTLDVFVSLTCVLNEMFDERVHARPQSPGGPLDAVFKDWGPHCKGKGKCITWRDLSAWTWRLQRKDGQPNQATMQILFFAQCVMRGFLHKLVQVEGNISDQLEAGEAVFWKPYVDIMRREVQSYKHVDQNDSGLPEFVKDEVTAMWRRVKKQVSGNNKETLKQALAQRGAQIIELYE